ncbi:MAG TPA: glutamine-hydrolyzing carbamoyl-phosphate synthase small subunit [Candidatus Peribacterales bacterium]|nr:glutamine-hydrolyzing carbamoyl-phosphate synthase small subunit [Candidatus Peribacterales bacterium]
MASLTLSDGTVFEGKSFGAGIDTDGEVVFNTAMVGYPESLTDPSYRGQILVFTYPLIGNYGVPSEELNEWGFSKNFESENIHVRGVICAQVSEEYSHFAAVMSFSDWLKKHNIPGITGIDTRALTKKLREKGVMLGKMLSSSESATADESRGIHIEDPNLLNLVAEVSCKEVMTYEPSLDSVALFSSERNPEPFDSTQDRLREGLSESRDARPHSRRATIVAYDCGMKRNIIRSFLKRGVRVIRVPWDFDLASADFDYDAVFISNGPGDPKMCTATINQIRFALQHNIPTFGICLGNQLLALAIGGDTYKLKYGHRSANQPCVEMQRLKDDSMLDERLAVSDKRLEENDELAAHRSAFTTRCIITSQNHGFAVSEELPTGWHVWFRNANDGTVEGIRHESKPFFSVQFHPEATPGPEDAGYLFDEFLSVLEKMPAGITY